MTNRTSFIARIFAVGILASTVFGAITPAMAQTGSGRASIVAILRRAAVVTASEKSFHTQGSGALVLMEATQGYSVSIKIGATFRGDASDRGKLSAHLRGQVRIAGHGEYFKLVDSGKRAAGKYGKHPWQCATIPTPTPAPTPLNAPNLGVIGKYLRGLARKVRLVNLGAGVDHGVAVWRIQGTVVTRLNLAPLETAVRASHKITVAQVAKLPRPWVHAKVNVWISQAKYTVQRITIHFKLRTGHKTSVAYIGNLNDHMSRYGEHVTAALPPSCAKGVTPS